MFSSKITAHQHGTWVKDTISSTCLFSVGTLKFLCSGQKFAVAIGKKNNWEKIILEIIEKQSIQKEQEPVPSAKKFIKVSLLA